MKQEEKQMRQYLRQIGRQLEVTGTLRERILSDLENDIRGGLEQGETMEKIRDRMGTPEEIGKAIFGGTGDGSEAVLDLAAQGGPAAVGRGSGDPCTVEPAGPGSYCPAWRGQKGIRQPSSEELTAPHPYLLSEAPTAPHLFLWPDGLAEIGRNHGR